MVARMSRTISHGHVSGVTVKDTIVSNRKKAPLATKHFIGLTDVPNMREDQSKFLGQSVPEYAISWAHICDERCDGYSFEDDPFLAEIDDENEDVGYWDD
jgi:hypothetical protein